MYEPSEWKDWLESEQTKEALAKIETFRLQLLESCVLRDKEERNAVLDMLRGIAIVNDLLQSLKIKDEEVK